MRGILIKNCKPNHQVNIISFFISYERNVSFINILQNIDLDIACNVLTHTSITFVWKKIKKIEFVIFLYFVPPTSCYLELSLKVKLLSGTVLL